MNKYWIAFAVSSFVVAIDQLSKWLVRRDLPIYSKTELLPFLDLTHIRNTGAAFGILADLPESIRLPLFVLVLITAVIVILLFLKNTDSRHKTLILGLSLILGGAVGNSIDRFRLRYVTDFIDFHWFGNPALHWPPFNLADSAITIGVILILTDTFLLRREKQ